MSDGRTRWCFILGCGMLIAPQGAWLASAHGAIDAHECEYEWALSTRGVAIGTASDRVLIAADGAREISSDFHPNAVLALFGVDPATREFRIDAQGRAGRRIETRAGSRPEINQWQRQEGGAWVRSLNGMPDKRQVPTEAMVIDSTSFPYLLQLGLLSPAAASSAVAVISKGKIYPATLRLQLSDAASEAYQLEFSSADGQGRAFLAQDLRPLRIEFTDEHGTLKGELRQWHCH